MRYQRFRHSHECSDCAHLLEPGCSINAAQLEAGSPERDSSAPAMALERYTFYVKLLFEIKAREESDIKALQAVKQEREGGSKVKNSKVRT